MADLSKYSQGISPITRLLNLMRLDRKEIGRIYLFAIFSGLINLSLPLGVQAIVNFVQGAQVSTSLVMLVAFILVGIFLVGLLQIYQMRLTERIQQRIYVRSAFDISLRIPHIKQEIYNKFFAPDLINRFFDTLTVQKSIAKLLIDFSTALLQGIFGLILLSFYHPFFIAFGFVLIIVVLFIFYFTGPAGLRTSLKESQYKYEMAHWLEEMGRMAMSFRLLGKNKITTSRTDELAKGYVDARNSHFRVLLIQYWALVAFKLLVSAGLLILGALLVIEQQITIGQFVATEIIILLVISSVEKLILSMETVYDLLTGLEKLGGLTDLPMEDDKETLVLNPGKNQGLEVAVQDVSFRFPDGRKDVLYDVSFLAKPGQKVAVYGTMGSGKTTLLHLIASLYQPNKGTILINGKPLKRIHHRDFYDNAGFYFHYDHLYKGTILDNISMGRVGVTQSNVEEVSKRLGLSPMIEKLPNGLLTEVEPLGKRLPRSIRSMIVLARALVHRPKLLLLEETFDMYGPEERKALLHNLTTKFKNTTIIAVTNQTEYLRNADYIVHLEDGTIDNKGTFDEIKNTNWFKAINHA